MHSLKVGSDACTVAIRSDQHPKTIGTAEHTAKTELLLSDASRGKRRTRMAIYSCKDCGNRYPGCHSTCEKYKADKVKHDELKAKIDFAKNVNSGLYKQRERSLTNVLKRKPGHKWSKGG
jgi:hypothetical protein